MTVTFNYNTLSYTNIKETTSMIEQQVAIFNNMYKANDICKVPTIPTKAQMMTFGDLIIEELQELALAHDSNDPKEFLDAICDIIYVTAQQAHLYGWPIQKGLEEVQRSNMSKLDEDGKPIIREDGKVLKGPSFSEPDFTNLLTNVQLNQEEV